MNNYPFFATLLTNAVVFLATLTASAEMMPTVVVGSAMVPLSSDVQAGHVDIWMDYEGDMAIDLAGFQFAISVSGPGDGVRFTNLGLPDDRPYLFSPASSGPVGNISNNGATLELGDFLLSGTVPLDSGDAIARIMFEVAPHTLGSYAVEVSTDPAESFLATSVSDFIPFSVENGSITTIPEPTSSLLGLTAIGLIIGVRRRRVGVG